MSTWRRKAIDIIPELKAGIEFCETPSYLWVELTEAFFRCVESGNDELAKKIIRYASWCTSPHAGDDSNATHQAVYCGFLESITNYHNYFPLFNKWFSQDEFEKYKGSFQAALNERDYKKLEDTFYER